VHTVGGVVGAGEALMTVVPEHDQLVAEVMISPADIDQVYPGQKATIRLSAFDRTTTPELDALLTYIAADLTKDERTGASYYSAKIAVAHGEIERLKDLKMVPGMPVEAFIRTTDRTILSYLLKPLADQMSRAFRES
jgi:HlyD family secretion protein